MTNEAAPSSELYKTILSQPDVLRALRRDMGESVARATTVLNGVRRVYICGTGTSHHAAIVGSHLLRLGGVDAVALSHIDYALYGPPTHPSDVLITISHRGAKRYGKAAVARALAGAMSVVGVTGQGSPMEGPDVILYTASQEISSTHTASYTATLAALALLAISAGPRRGYDVAALQEAVERVPDLVETMLAREAALRPLAEVLASRGRIILAGAGPHAATAREGALKIKESSYLVAEGMDVETALHGCLQAVEKDDLAVVIVADGPASDRCGDLLTALEIVGARTVAIADERVTAALPAQQEGGATRVVISYPAVPEALSALLAVVPLQLLAAYTALYRGTDADSFRGDDPTYARSTASYAL